MFSFSPTGREICISSEDKAISLCVYCIEESKCYLKCTLPVSKERVKIKKCSWIGCNYIITLCEDGDLFVFDVIRGIKIDNIETNKRIPIDFVVTSTETLLVLCLRGEKLLAIEMDIKGNLIRKMKCGKFQKNKKFQLAKGLNDEFLLFNESKSKILHYDKKGNILCSVQVHDETIQAMGTLEGRHVFWSLSSANHLQLFDLKGKNRINDIELQDDELNDFNYSDPWLLLCYKDKVLLIRVDEKLCLVSTLSTNCEAHTFVGGCLNVNQLNLVFQNKVTSKIVVERIQFFDGKEGKILLDSYHAGNVKKETFSTSLSIPPLVVRSSLHESVTTDAHHFHSKRTKRDDSISSRLDGMEQHLLSSFSLPPKKKIKRIHPKDLSTFIYQSLISNNGEMLRELNFVLGYRYPRNTIHSALNLLFEKDLLPLFFSKLVEEFIVYPGRTIHWIRSIVIFFLKFTMNKKPDRDENDKLTPQMLPEITKLLNFAKSADNLSKLTDFCSRLQLIIFLNRKEKKEND